MIISVSGYNYSGSSAIIDLLKEYDETTIVEPELAFIYLPDGLIDLYNSINNSASYLCGEVAAQRYYNLCKHSSVPSIYHKTFLKLTQRYLTELSTEKWKGKSAFDGTRKKRFEYMWWTIKKMIGNVVWHFFHKTLPINEREMRLLFNNQDFQLLTEKYFKEIEDLFSQKKEITVFNQLVSAYNPFICMKYLYNGKAIIVNRDPRDIYLLGKVKHETSCYPSDDPEKYVNWYRSCFNRCKRESTADVLFIWFEEIVYNYEQTVSKIEDFLQINRHSFPKKYFKPEISINNTQLKQRFMEYKDEIEYIEQELSEYLYDFPDFVSTTKDFF